MRNAVTLVWGLLRLAPMKLHILCVVMCFLVFNMSFQEFMYCYHTVIKGCYDTSLNITLLKY